MPGIKKFKGDTDWEELIPPHPLISKASATNIATLIQFQFNLTSIL